METIKRLSKKQITVIFFVAIIALVIFLTGCSTSNNEISSVNNNTANSISADNNGEATVDTDSEVAQLSGTCTRNNSCSYPGKCGSYIDLDNDGLCDLGQ